jgi:pimeloyl-ACP methyl ester carboxylesterase
MFLLLLVLTSADTARTVQIPVAPGESLTVMMVGEGAPVVLLPGLFGSLYSYRYVMARLDSAGYGSFAIEPLGMGTSSRPEGADYSLTAQADRVAAVLDTLAIRGALFVGHSLGASIAMRVAYRRPELVRGVVSLEGGPAETATTKSFRRWMRLAPIVRMLDMRWIMRQMLPRSMKSVSFDDSWVNTRVVREYTSGLSRDPRATIKAYQGMARTEEPELLRDHLRAIVCPVVLLVGETKHDAGPPSEEVILLVERLPSFTMDTVARSGYFIQEEQPAAVVDVVSGFGSGGTCGG